MKRPGVLLLTALLLGCATADQPRRGEDAPDVVPMSVVNAALVKLKAEGLELVQQRDDAREEAEKYRKQLIECEAGRRT